jgi:Lrp/AsnC family leucine-responsive transcriptional regulator
MSLDAMDRAILDILQREGRITNVELAQRIGLSPGPTLARVNKLESGGFIDGYTALVNRAKVGLAVTAFVLVSLREHNRVANDAFLAAVSTLPEVLEIHHIAGDEDFLLKVVAESPASYETFMLERLTTVADLHRVKTVFVLSSPKSSTAIPVLE